MSVKLFSVTTFDMNGEDFTYTVCAEDPIDAAVLAMESRLKNELEGDLEELQEEISGEIKVVTIATMGSFDQVGVVEPLDDPIALPGERIIGMVLERQDAETPTP